MGLVAEKVAIKIILNHIRNKGFNQRSAVIVGAGKVGRNLAHYLDENRWMGIKLIGFFDDSLSEGEVVTGSPIDLGSILGPIDKCPGFALEKDIDMVFITLSMRAKEKINRLLWELGTKGVYFL